MIKNGYKFNDHQLAWLDALRSGNYKQGKGHLWEIPENEPDGEKRFCCLGVAMDLFDKGDRYMYIDMYAEGYPVSEGGTANEAVKAKLDLRGFSGFFEGTGIAYKSALGNPYEAHTLIELNDDVGYSFEQIADFIEDNPTKVFATNTIQST